MSANFSKVDGGLIPDFNLDDAVGVLSRLHERLKSSPGSGIRVTQREQSAIDGAVSIMEIIGKRPGPKKPKPKPR